MATWFRYFIEMMFGLGLFFNAVLFIPQALKLWKTKTAKNMSFFTFVGFIFVLFFTVLHAYFYSDYILFYGTILAMLSCSCIVLLIWKYRHVE